MFHSFDGGQTWQKVAGNLPGLLGFGQNGRGDSSDTNVLNQPKVDTKMFQFPIDVTSEPGMGNQGHYIMFYINEQDRAQLSMSERAGTGGSVVDDPKRKYNFAGFIKNNENLKLVFHFAPVKDYLKWYSCTL